MMKTITTTFLQIILFTIVFGLGAQAQSGTNKNNSSTKNQIAMKTFLIEREIPGAGKFTPEQLKGISQKSCAVIKDLGPEIVWVQSYVTGNKIYCIYNATDEKLIREHALKGGFPANTIIEVSAGISPTTAE